MTSGETTITGPMEMREGDFLTMAGIYRKVSNPDRRWWQFWKQAFVDGDELQLFVVTADSRAMPDGA